MSDRPDRATRRDFLKLAGVLAASTAVGCKLESHVPETIGAPANDRVTGFDRSVLDAVGNAVLPAELGEKGRDAAIGQFVAWVDGYDPVAEEMHGYGYSDVRYLPPDPAPAWRAQLAALDVMSRKSRQQPFAKLSIDARRELLAPMLASQGSDRLPEPLHAPHVALALLAHWASSPDAWDLALGVKVLPGTCRVLGDANAKPLPIIGLRA
ncbi:MAG: gluconate 2-dehydrogenase subunit 3 family protein [Gemmatimonadaceae bacterium]|nr:gluconate 2-dehydrogenase subunit 3 family protein [Gemmatimonadaceae bacterium]